MVTPNADSVLQKENHFFFIGIEIKVTVTRTLYCINKLSHSVCILKPQLLLKYLYYSALKCYSTFCVEIIIARKQNYNFIEF